MGNVKSARFAQKKAEALNKEWYSTRSLLGNTWAIFYILIGGREAGKSYDVMRLMLKDWKEKRKPFTWLRLNEKSMQKMLRNKADQLVDADLRRKFDLDLSVNGNQVFDHGKPMCKVLALSTFYNDKGVALYDNEYDLGYNIVLDEMNREISEKRTFDINYAFVNQMENLVRSTKENIRVFLIGNTLEEASDIMCSFGFIPEEFGRYYIHKKRAVVDYIPPSERYLKRRKGTVAELLAPDASTFTNRIEVSRAQIVKNRLTKPQTILMFSKNQSDWFTVWTGNIITGYHGEQVRKIPMRPYLDEVFYPTERDNVYAQYDIQKYYFRDLFTQKNFKRQMEMLRPRK